MTIDIKKFLSNDRRSLAKAITLVESSKESDRNLAQNFLKEILPRTGKSIRIGISGVPGVGKSTFIESFGLQLIGAGHKVAVLAIDPSSPLTGGSILGDKTRMEKLANADDAFVRPSPAGDNLGGVAHKTREAILLCEANGYDIIIIETVGVGQSEVQVASMVDFFLVLMLPNAGDELQGIKKGILELSDLIVINKADGENLNLAKLAQSQYQSALNIFSHDSFWKTEVMLASGLKSEGLDAIKGKIFEYVKKSKDADYFEKKRNLQTSSWLKSLIQEIININFFENENFKPTFQKIEKEMLKKKVTPFDAASQLVSLILSKPKS